jgi:hypothetical protein
MSRFPLYDSFSKNIEDVDLTISKKRSFLKYIKEIDANGHELVYALIRMYQVEECEENSFTLPYNGAFIKNNIKFDLESFPFKLKQILYEFLVAHLRKMKEE